MLIELSNFSDKLRQYRLILEKLTADQQSYERRREKLSKLSQRRRSSRKPDVAECYMCNANIELESTDSFATCRGCERLVCRGDSCSQWVDSIGIWECTGCQSNRVIQQKAGEWLLNQLTARLKQPGPVELSEGNLLGLGLESDDARSTASSTVSVNQRIKVREFIEELLSSMLHGPLDDVTVGQLMKHESYLPLWEGQQQHHSPSDQHFELKRLIQKILEEIGKLPELLNHSGLPLRPEEHLPYFDPKKYEQLLATAVLNKVVDDYRNPKNFTDGGDVAGKSAGAAKPYGTVDINHNQLTETAGQQGLLGEETLRQMSVAADEGVHPHDGVSYTASGDRRLSDDTDESYLSDYIQRHKVPLPDLSDTTGSGSGAEDDDLQSLKSNATDGTWEENWLFRKRQLKTTESSIAMLVPSPTEEVKALIGDKNADEISDLSEAGSDCEGYESDGVANGSGKDSTSAPTEGPPVAVLALASSSKDTSEDISCSSKTHDSLEEHLAPDSLVSVNSLPVTEKALLETRNSQLLAEQSQGLLVDDLISIGPVADKVETTNPFLGDAFEANNNVITDDVKLLQRTEAGDSRGSASELSPANGYGDRKEIPIDRAQKAEEAPMLPASNGDGLEQDQELSLDLPDTLIPGSIAEREHLKWRNAKPIANNPYSPDALQRRLSEKSRPTSMIEIDRLVRKEVAPVAVDDEDPPKEPTDSGTENDRSLQSVMGGVLAETKKIGREYYINDPERLRSGGAPVKQTLGPSQQQHQQAQLSHSTDDEKVSHQTYYTLPADSYIMDRFLNNAPASGTGTRCSTVGRSPSTRSIRSLPQHELAASGALHRAASVDLGYQTKTPSAAGSDTAVDIPAHILAQFEQETLHSDYKRDSFRARHATTRQFVLNPIFDEQQSSPGPEGTRDERTWTRPAATLPRKSATAATAGAGSPAAARTSSGAVVETVFTDLGTLRRSASVKSRIEQFSGPFPAIRRTDSYRSTLSK